MLPSHCNYFAAIFCDYINWPLPKLSRQMQQVYESNYKIYNMPTCHGLLTLREGPETDREGIRRRDRQFYQPMQYWLRRPIGFWQVQKVGQIRHLFPIHKTHKTRNFALCETVVTHILQPKLFQKANVAIIKVNVQKRLNGASVTAEFWHGEK